MAVRDQGEAMDLVKDSLGLTRDDLGMDRENPFEGMDFGEENEEGGEEVENAGFGNEDPAQDEPNAPEATTQEYNDLQERVTHTPPQEPQTRPMPAATGLTTDRRGNILNREGKVVARAGKEARLFTDNHKLRSQIGTLTNQANFAIRDTQGKLEKAIDIGMAMSRQLQEMRNQPNLEKEYNISNSELRFAADLARSAKTDPIGTLKTLLTKAAASGIDLTQLGLSPGGFDSAALMKLVREEIANGVKPVTQMTEQQRVERETQQQTAASQQAVNEELNTFLTENPVARGYLPVFKQIYSQPQLAKLSLGEVWTRIQLNLLKRGIDVNNPPQQQRTPNRQQPRLPNGRGNPPGGGRGREQPSELAPVSASYDDIVRSVLTGRV